MSQSYALRPAMPADAEMLSQLVCASFDAQVAADWAPEACAVFHTEMAPQPMQTMLAEAAYAQVAELGGQIVGLLLMKTPAVLTLLFVRPDRLRQGIGSTLWQAAQYWLDAEQPDVHTIELNASLGAVDFYRSMGFWPISERYEARGASAVRMACWLPAMRLAALRAMGQDLP